MVPREKLALPPSHDAMPARARRPVGQGEPAGGSAMMRRWARHWLRTCRAVPLRARRLIDRMEHDPAKRIHDFRRLMKAWRSLLKLAPAALAVEASAMQAEIKHLRRSFGAARDAAVVAKTLDGIRTLDGIMPGQAQEAVVPEIVAELHEQFDAVRDRLDRLAAEMATWSVAEEGGGFLVIAFKRTYRRARRRARRDPEQMGLKRLHAWRTAVIDLGYQLSFFKPADPVALEAQAGAAERLRGHLGSVVDLDMAREHLAGAVSARRRARAEREIAQGIAKRRRKAARIARRLLGERPRTLCLQLAKAMGSREPRRVKLA